MNSINHYLLQCSSQFPSTDFLLELTPLVLSPNAFRFEEEIFLQTGGMALGKFIAPSYANLFMGFLEQDFLSEESLVLLLSLRFIDGYG